MARIVALVVFALTMTSIVAAQQDGATRRLARVPAPVGADGRVEDLYTASYALLVGVSRYDDGAAWAALDSVTNELSEVRTALLGLGFSDVQTVANPTGLELRRAVEGFIQRRGFEASARLVFLFSGHGYTLDNGTRGFFVTRDAPDPLKNESGFRGTAVSMDQVATWAREITAKHALFAFDSCFSGTIFQTRDRAVPRPITNLTNKKVREFLSAGSAGEPVPARSVFIPTLVRALNGEADLDRDGFITGTELGNWVQGRVIEYKTRQTPQFGKMRDPEYDGGDLVFAVPASPKPTSRPNPAPTLTLWPTPPPVVTASPHNRWAYANVASARGPERATTAARALVTAKVTGLLFNAAESGLIWAHPDFDLTKAFDAVVAGSTPTAGPRTVGRVAYVNVQRVAAESTLGKEYAAQVNASKDANTKSLNERNQRLAANRQKLEDERAVFSDAARTQLEQDLERQQREITRFAEDAQREVQALADRVEKDFTTKLIPVVNQVSAATGVDFVFNAGQSGLLWADPAIEITSAVTASFDRATGGASSNAAAPVVVPALAGTGVADVPRMAAESVLGKQFHARVQALNTSKANDLKIMQDRLAADEKRLKDGGAVFSDAARRVLEQQIARQKVDIQRFTEDAQREVQQLQTDLQEQFSKALMPVAQQVLAERQLQLIFDGPQSGIVASDASLDITALLIARLDARR